MRLPFRTVAFTLCSNSEPQMAHGDAGSRGTFFQRAVPTPGILLQSSSPVLTVLPCQCGSETQGVLEVTQEVPTGARKTAKTFDSKLLLKSIDLTALLPACLSIMPRAGVHKPGG